MGISHFKSKSKKFVSKGESECRRVLESLFGRKFVNVRPDFLLNPKTKRKLEIDCYNESLRFGVEFNGEAHMKFCPRFHNTYQQFLDQQERDQLKKELCELHHVLLISVPFDVKSIKQYLISEILENKHHFNYLTRIWIEFKIFYLQKWIR